VRVEAPDPLAALPAELRVDVADRARRGIRISLPRQPGEKSAAAAAVERAYRFVRGAGARRVAERPARYGEFWEVPPWRGEASDRLQQLEYAVVDVETTGGPAGGHRLTEFAAVRVDGQGRVLREYSTLLNPDRPIPPFITRLTRITHEMVTRAPRFDEVEAEIRDVLDGAVFVAHNAAFDWRFVCYELARLGGPPPRARVLCTVRLARKVVPELTSRSLDALQFLFDVENEARHRAFGDARATARIFARLLDRVDERAIEQWGELERLLGRRAPRRKRRALPEPMSER